MLSTLSQRRGVMAIRNAARYLINKNGYLLTLMHENNGRSKLVLNGLK